MLVTCLEQVPHLSAVVYDEFFVTFSSQPVRWSMSDNELSTRPVISSFLRHEGEMFVAGRWTAAASGATMTSIDPSTEQVLAEVPLAGADDIDAAVTAGLSAQPRWARTPWQERAAALTELASRVEAEAHNFAVLDAIDGGIPVAGMRKDVHNAVSFLRYFAGLASELKGETTEASTGFNLTLREPFGVVARIVPFNHPVQFAAQAIAAPLAAGNAVILKPADQTPLSALRLAELAEGLLPPGLLSVLTGNGLETGSTLVRHPQIPRVGFTGSVSTGRAVLRDAAEHIKTVSLELGGKNPLVICPDVDLDAAAAACVKAMNFTRGQGQSCGSPSRVFVHADVHDAFVNDLLRRVEQIVVGDPLSPDTGMGPLAYAAHYERVRSYVGVGRDERATLRIGGERPAGLDVGYFLQPTVFTDVTPDMRIAREEIFGPIVSVVRWHDEEVLLDAINDLPLGLTANIWTNDLSRAVGMARRIHAGYVWINGEGQRPLGAPFGGYGHSGIGKENDLSELLSYTQIKNVNLSVFPTTAGAMV